MNFRKILIANRGEIAVRIIRACRTLGIGPIAVYCRGEERALHVQMADAAYSLGPPLAGFLDAQELVHVAKEAGAGALHPGYGFLSEQPSLASACQKNAIAFIGPSATTLRQAGEKTQARRTMAKAGVPVVPGSPDIVAGLSEARDTARKIGYPVLLKAAYGGGGKGMKVAHFRRELDELFPIVQQESWRSFGKGGIFLEKYLKGAQHIEVQILCDHHGHIIHLGERNCSIQRRHQKLMEESPSPLLDPGVRDQLIGHALKAASLFRYRNAGTVEFLVDGENKIYFLEINARIQVEHPVTEMVTGIDLVAEQIRAAAGQPLRLSQRDIRFCGHALECRIYAEDPFSNFLPSTGKLDLLSIPGGPGVRVDTALTPGTSIDTSYDPLIAKVIAHAPDRATAIGRMQTALDEFWISPIRTTIPLFQRILRDRRFLRSELNTHYLQELDLKSVSRRTVDLGLILAALLEFGGHITEPKLSFNSGSVMCPQNSGRDRVPNSFNPWAD